MVCPGSWDDTILPIDLTALLKLITKLLYWKSWVVGLFEKLRGTAWVVVNVIGTSITLDFVLFRFQLLIINVSVICEQL